MPAVLKTHIGKCLEGREIAQKSIIAMWESLYVPLPGPLADGRPLENRRLEIPGIS